MGVVGSTGANIRFIGSESRLPGGAIKEGRWQVCTPNRFIASGLQFVDDHEARVVRLKNSHGWDLGFVERATGGDLYLTINQVDRPQQGYDSTKRILLTRGEDSRNIEQKHIDLMLAELKWHAPDTTWGLPAH